MSESMRELLSRLSEAHVRLANADAQIDSVEYELVAVLRERADQATLRFLEGPCGELYELVRKDDQIVGLSCPYKEPEIVRWNVPEGLNLIKHTFHAACARCRKNMREVPTEEAARNDAVTAGWCVVGGKWFCPSCLQAMGEPKDEKSLFPNLASLAPGFRKMADDFEVTKPVPVPAGPEDDGFEPF